MQQSSPPRSPTSRPAPLPGQPAQPAFEPVLPQEDQEPLVMTATQAVSRSNRRILVMGPRGTGKTTFSMSASNHAGDRITGPKRMCSDVLVFQGDNEGIMGALDAGLVCDRVIDMSGLSDWLSYTKKLAHGLRYFDKALRDGTIKIIIIDLNCPARLIDRTAPLNDYGKTMAAQGARIFDAFSPYRGVTVIGNAQMKVHTVFGEDSRKGATDNAIAASHARSIGGERSSYTIDLPKGMASMWLDNCSFVFTRKRRRVRDLENDVVLEYSTVTQSTSLYEAKSRAQAKLKTVEPGEISMRALLTRAYGEAA